MSDTVVIRRAREPFGYLGNMSPHAVSYHGAGGEFATAEALFQALRFPRDSSIREEIRAAASPMEAKAIAKKHGALMHVVPRSDQDLENMLFVMALKVVRHPEVRSGLLSTDDRRIVEDCTARQTESGLFWGAAWLDGMWSGSNMLGLLWMEMRRRLRAATHVQESLPLGDD